MNKNTEFEQELKLLSYDMKSLSARWLRVENKYDQIQSKLKQNMIRLDVIIILQLFTAILLGAGLL